MKKTIILFVLLLAASFSVSAQIGMYEALEAHGEGAKYQEYWSVGKSEETGKYHIDGKRYVLTAEIKRLPSGVPVGFSLIKVEDGKSWRGADVMTDYERAIGYPHIVTRHKYNKDGYAVVGDYIFSLDGISEDGLSFDRIDAIYIKIGGEEKAEEEPKEKKKMSLKEKMKAAKEKVKAAAMVSYGPEHQKACDTDLGKLVSDYLKEMKAKQDANPATAKQKAEIKEIEFARKNKDADLKAYNDSIRATPEYKKLKEHQKRMAEMEKGSAGEKVTIVNGTSSPIRVDSFNITPGSSRTFDCDFDIYLMKTDKAKNEVVRSRKLSSARTNCGRTITVN
ncbi:hypothetical protein R9C00_28955 [Flammeovirgaceae bacterium SG7u.111]|nr:hypothetical protein [Flammeovirgaceae bacterium SG7u.132]WPO35729.1 hypothetical protein R9C00_28955 [Flammeovirgaceae bacterium SG7u.111]